MSVWFHVLPVLFLSVLAGCAGDSYTANDPPVPLAEAAAPRDADSAPDQYRVKFETTTGEFIVEVTRNWAPRGADQFYKLVQSGFYDDTGFFRVVPGFVVQFGLSGDPEVQKKWKEPIRDDPVVRSNRRGYLTFATAGPHSRTTQVFISYGDNLQLDRMGFAPFGRVVEGMDVVDAINAEYGEGPNQGRIQADGNEYLRANYPRLDFIEKATVLDADAE